MINIDFLRVFSFIPYISFFDYVRNKERSLFFQSFLMVYCLMCLFISRNALRDLNVYEYHHINHVYQEKERNKWGKARTAWFELNTSIIDGKALTMWYLILDCSLWWGIIERKDMTGPGLSLKSIQKRKHTSNYDDDESMVTGQWR